MSAFEANVSSDTKRSRGGKNAEIDSALLEWFRKARSKNIPISGPILQEKALQIAKALDVAPSEFKASNGWLDRFKNRNGIKARSISGEAGDVSQTTVDSWKERLPDILQGWEPENIWNMDETGQFFRALPNKSLADSSCTCTGGKKSKERLTCAFFVNAKGGKEKPIVVGKSANPRCLKGISDRSTLPCQYFNQRKAWMESGILEKILSNLNRRLKTQNRRILLLMDNAPCHPEDLDEKFTQINVVFLPANTTSLLQPLDLGIIQAFKLKYYRCLLTHVVSKIDECSTASEVCKSIDILQAMRWTAMAWNDVSESTVVKCFIKAGILTSEGELNALEVANSDVDPFAELQSEISNVEDMAHQVSGVNTIGIKEAVSGCYDPPVCKELPDNWEDSFFSDLNVNQETIDINDSDDENNANDDYNEEEVAVASLKVFSYEEAVANLEDALQFLQSKGNINTANELSKVIFQTQNDWLETKKRQSKVTDFFTKS